MSKVRRYSPVAREVARLLGGRISAARRERRWTVQQFAERVGVTPPTIRKIERGDLGVAVGSVFEAASILGVPLFAADPSRRALDARHVDDQLALLPQRVRRPARVRNDF